MSQPLSEKTIAIVKACVPALEGHGLAITRAMYARLFRNESIKSLFDQSHQGENGSQPKALAAAVLAYAQNIDNLGVLGPAVERIAQKHVGLQIQPEHYDHVAEALLGAIAEVLGDAATPEILEAWGEAYWFLANILIGRETQLYGETAAAAGGWTGLRDFTVAERTTESGVITSFVLRPADGGPVLRHRAGQHLTLLLDGVPGGALKRNYTISTAGDGRAYRISVKREPQGAASQWLHDCAPVGTALKVVAPSGDFVLPETQSRPVVLLSGGVGLTPMIAMLETLAARGSDLAVQYVHCTTDGATHAFGAHARALAARLPNAAVTTFYSRPRAEDVQGRDYDHAGRVGLDWVKANTPLAEADYFLCGPLGFLRGFVSGLVGAGVPLDRIRYEFFGPMEDLLDEVPQAAATGSAPAGTPLKPVEGAAAADPAAVGAALIGSASDAVVASDAKGAIILWNPGAERIFGFTAAEAIGQSLDIIIPEPFRARHWEGYDQTVASGQSRYGAGDLLAVPGLRKDGRRISIEFTIVLMKAPDGAVTGMASVIRDVTKRFEETRALKKQIAALTEGKS